MVFTRTLYFLPASNARVLVSLSTATLAVLIPPPYPGIALSEAMKLSDTAAPPSFMVGPIFCNRDTSEYNDDDRAAKEPFG